MTSRFDRVVFSKSRDGGSNCDQRSCFSPHLQPIICPTAFASASQTLTSSSSVVLYKEKEREMIKVPERQREGKQV